MGEGLRDSGTSSTVEYKGSIGKERRMWRRREVEKGRAE